MNEYLLSPAEFNATARKIEAINARAAKRGFTGSFRLAGVSEIIQETSPTGLPVARVMYRCTLDGEAPSYGGWRFLAALEGLPAAGGGDVAWIVRCAPGVSDEGVDRSTLRVGFCSHCGVARANRRKLFLVQHVESRHRLKQIWVCLGKSQTRDQAVLGCPNAHPRTGLLRCGDRARDS
ncbi:hypothetical protein [Leucobacter sp. cx-169]|uniref:hypothetical protein n=1 Tax=Leucobacter sp. cx-169 TaxID=2770549 RepID=UPI00165D7B92|nr:hypothetical protein [Leucobacter sp. cx-169]MBC9927228.1 hypothetical protein [Leucobacter sp. cx-169]